MKPDDYELAVRQHKDRLMSYSTWFLRDTEEARDVTQETLIRLWSHRQTVRIDACRSWLLKTAHNLCLDRIRRRKTRGETDPDVLTRMADPVRPGPERSAGSEELGRMIGQALGGLDPVDRSLVLMREVQGLTYDEMAMATDLPLGTIKAKIHRARGRLRKELTAAGVQP